MTETSVRDEQRHAFFEDLADGWDARNHPPEDLAQVERMFAELRPELGRTILDAGGGQGVIVPYVRALAGRAARIIVLDSSAAMLRGVEAKDADALALHAKAESIPLIDAYVDTVLCYSAFPHFSDKAAAAREFFRVLKPGGRVYVLHTASSEEIGGLHDKHRAVQGDYLPCAHGMRNIFAGAGFCELELIDEPGKYYFSAVKREA